MLTMGHYVIVPTPFSSDGAVDEASLRRVVRRAIEGGAAGLVALGVMGEAAFLDDRERALVLAAVLDECARAVPVVVGVSAAETEIAIARSRDATALGVDAVMCLLPDTSHGKVYAEDIEPNLKDGDMLMFAHGFSIHFGTVMPPTGVTTDQKARGSNPFRYTKENPVQDGIFTF